MKSTKKLDAEFTNITSSINSKLGKRLHNLRTHPLGIIKKRIYEYFDSLDVKFTKHDNMPCVVNIVENFDKLLIGPNHPARSKSDTYYVNQTHVLRTHTSAHQNELLAQGEHNFLVTGDVYRKDEIDSTHYPVFHQMEGVGLVAPDKDPKEELLKILGGLVEWLFPGCEYRTNDDYFPFTEPSFEIEVNFEGKWLEILGCGVMHEQIIKNNKLEPSKYCAFGLGLERLAMILFEIPDIRYFWNEHQRFTEQFASGKIVKFKPFSKLDCISNDISFWIPEKKIHVITKEESFEDQGELCWDQANDFFDIVRDIGGDWISLVECKDQFYHKKKAKHSHMYRITFSPLDPNLKDSGEFFRKVQNMQEQIRTKVEQSLDIELR